MLVQYINLTINQLIYYEVIKTTNPLSSVFHAHKSLMYLITITIRDNKQHRSNDKQEHIVYSYHTQGLITVSCLLMEILPQLCWSYREYTISILFYDHVNINIH